MNSFIVPPSEKRQELGKGWNLPSCTNIKKKKSITPQTKQRLGLWLGFAFSLSSSHPQTFVCGNDKLSWFLCLKEVRRCFHSLGKEAEEKNSHGEVDRRESLTLRPITFKTYGVTPRSKETRSIFPISITSAPRDLVYNQRYGLSSKDNVLALNRWKLPLKEKARTSNRLFSLLLDILPPFCPSCLPPLTSYTPFLKWPHLSPPW